jgi:hypothetical protein
LVPHALAQAPGESSKATDRREPTPTDIPFSPPIPKDWPFVDRWDGMSIREKDPAPHYTLSIPEPSTPERNKPKVVKTTTEGLCCAPPSALDQLDPHPALDPRPVIGPGSAIERVALVKANGVYYVPAEINGALTASLMVDSGASFVILESDEFPPVRCP